MTTNLEFYQKAAEIQNELAHKSNGHLYRPILYDIVFIYFQNGNKFPEVIHLNDISHKRLSTIQEFLIRLGFFDTHTIEHYEFVRKYKLKYSSSCKCNYKVTHLIVRPKKINSL